MIQQPPINRVVHTAFVCGLVGYTLTWFVHLWLKQFFRVISPFVIEGTVAAISGGVVSAVLGLVLGRTIRGPRTRMLLGFAVVMFVPLVMAALGIAGMMTAGVLTDQPSVRRLLRANQNHRIVESAYCVFPIIWTLVLPRILCWYFRATKGVSLLNLSRIATRDQDCDNSITPRCEAGSVLRSVCLACLASWLIHRQIDSRIRWIWQSPIEGAATLLTAAMVSSVTFLYFDRAVRNRFARMAVAPCLALLIGATCGFAGYFGYQSAQFLSGLTNAHLDQETLLHGYYVFPPLWAGLLTVIFCWYYKAMHGGVSLLNFDPPDRYDAER